MLVIDDDPSLRLLLRTFFEKKGFIVDEAADGAQAYARVTGVDIILLDHMLPDQTGIEVLRQLRANGCTAPILMLTADSSPETAVTAREAGADDHVLKPFSLPVLLACIERRLRVVVDDETRDRC